MLLCVLRPIVRLALWIFFRKIDVRGHDRVPSDRSLVFAANHPNVMLDTLILGLTLPDSVPRFLGKSTLFKNPFYAWFLRQLGVIPVARTRDRGSKTYSNRDMLRAACGALRDGHSLVIFPEGISHAEIKVRDLKPGAARIALRTEAEADGQTGVCIVPVGLTYTDPGLFRSDVSVHFGEAIEILPFLRAYHENRNAAEQDLTAQIHERLTALTRHIDNPNLRTVINDLSAIYTDTVADEIPDSSELSRKLQAQQEIIQAVHHFAQADPELVRTFAERLCAHHRKLRRLRLSPDLPPASSPPGGCLLLALLTSPIVLYGFIHNALPYYLPRLFVRPYRDKPETIGTVKMAVGAVLFPLWYLILVGVACLLMDLQSALIYGLTLPTSGLVTLLFDEHILQKWPLWQSVVLPRKRRYYLNRLSRERATIIHDLNAIKEPYRSKKFGGGF